MVFLPSENMSLYCGPIEVAVGHRTWSCSGDTTSFFFIRPKLQWFWLVPCLLAILLDDAWQARLIFDLLLSASW